MAVRKNPCKAIENDPIGFMLSIPSFQATADKLRQDIFRDEVNGFTVDTVIGPDTNLWETGVLPQGERWIIVEQYDNREAAEKGHKKWMDQIRNDPTIKLVDVFEAEID